MGDQILSSAGAGRSCAYELFFPLEGPGSHRGGNPRKMGKNYKIPLPGPTPENGEKLHKNYKNCIFGVILPLFWGNFPHFRGSDRGGEFCNFSPFFGDFRPGGFPGPLRGKTTDGQGNQGHCSRNRA